MTGHMEPGGQRMGTTRTTSDDVHLVVPRKMRCKEAPCGPKAHNADTQGQASKEDKRRNTRPSR